MTTNPIPLPMVGAEINKEVLTLDMDKRETGEEGQLLE
jgi:hypothetical protein